ncbi:MAG: sodium:proton antiporter NhaD [Bacteroidetes bacterium]|nr:sodium:proton antiporter NhaD [Bacteroidota bacterium]
MSLEIILGIIFIIGYAMIIFEHPLKIDKAAAALLTGVLIWAGFVLGSPDGHEIVEKFTHHIPDIAGILLFLIGAMTIVELIDLHQGFDIVVNKITTRNKRKLLWILGFLTFFLSAVLDNLTTAIVMISLLRKIIKDKEEKMLFAGIVIIAANAGGAWSPIGDITTTMLWIGGQITTMPIMMGVIIPSLVCLVVPIFAITFQFKGEFPVMEKVHTASNATSTEKIAALSLGLGALIFVPIFKSITHLPPFMGMLLGLGIMWMVLDLIHKDKEPDDKHHFSVNKALTKIDVPSVLFFFGILSAIAGLESIGLLEKIAKAMDDTIGNNDIIVYCIGLLSAIIDNVPLVAATQGMYSLTDFPVDHEMWHFIAYCAGTGGSILIIGSAAGVAVMGLEKINFIWYAKKIGWLAFLGYTAGAIVHLALLKAGIA